MILECTIATLAAFFASLAFYANWKLKCDALEEELKEQREETREWKKRYNELVRAVENSYTG